MVRQTWSPPLIVLQHPFGGLLPCVWVTPMMRALAPPTISMVIFGLFPLFLSVVRHFPYRRPSFLAPHLFPLADPSSDQHAFVAGVPGVPSGVNVVIEPRPSGVDVVTEPCPSPRSAVPSVVASSRKSTVRPKKPRVKHSSGTAFVKCSETGNLSLQDVPLDIMTVEGLRTLLIAHRVKGYSSVRRKDEYVSLLRAHVCAPVCVDLKFVMEHTAPKSKPVASPDADPVEVPDQSVVDAVADLIDRNFRVPRDSKFPPSLTKEIKNNVISNWLDKFSNQSMKLVVCAVCAERLLESQTDVIPLSEQQLSILTNSSLPVGIFPTTYDPATFHHAILDSKGFVPQDDGSHHFVICKSCGNYLKRMKLPPLALANDNYLGRDCVPENIRKLFEDATPVELSLIARYRVRCTIHKYSAKDVSSPDSAAPSQRYLHGNTITFANECTSLLSVLPPPSEVLGETICVMFVGAVFPSPEEIQKMTPLLARRHVVWDLLNWLKSNHPGYKDVTLSRDNLDSLLPLDSESGPRIPNGVFMSHIPSKARDSESSGYTNEEDDLVEGPSIPTALNGIISQTIEGLTIRENKALAIKHWKSGGGAFTIPHSSEPINEYNNPTLFPCMFPHLFPWGLGGFEDKGRRVPVGLEAHVKHMLNLSDTDPQTDHSFSFVAMNILQRRTTAKASRFKVKSSYYDRAAELLCSVEASACDSIVARSQANNGYVKPQSAAERDLFELMEKVNVISSAVPGSSASKVKMRNEIRSLMNWLGSPTLFLTLNPADLHSPLFCHFAGAKVDLDSREPDLPSHFERQLLLAKNPAAAARFFHSLMRAFIDVVLDMENTNGGLFGRVSGYYGTIEAQGRGSLHCHMMIWIGGSLGPDDLRQKLGDDLDFRQSLFDWLNDVIKTDVPGQPYGITKDDAVFEKREKGERHPCTVRCPMPPLKPDSQCGCDSELSSSDMSCDCPMPPEYVQLEEQFDTEFQRQLYRIVLDSNWHFHRGTCWKYLKKGESRDDDKCRMRMNGATREKTELDTESGGILYRQTHPWINAYNDIVIMLLKSNMDISFIGSGHMAKALIYYITDYITKNGLPTHVAFSALQLAIQKVKKVSGDTNPDPNRSSEILSQVSEEGRRLLAKACNALIGQQELSGQQVAMYLQGLADGDGDHYTSHEFRTLYWAAFKGWLRQELIKEASRDLQSIQSIASNDIFAPADDDEKPDDTLPSSTSNAQLSDDSLGDEEVILDLSKEGSISLAHSQLKDYIFRGDLMTDISLYWYVATTERITYKSEKSRLDSRNHPIANAGAGAKSTPRSPFHPSHPHFKTHLVRLRKNCLVPVIIGPTLNSRNGDYEQYCCDMLLLFKPWRTLNDLRKPGESWAQAFQAYAFDDASNRIIQNMNHVHECRDAKDEYNELRRRGVRTQNLLDAKMMSAHHGREVGEPHADDEESEVLNVIRELAPHLLDRQFENADADRGRKPSRDELRAIRADDAVSTASAMGLNCLGIDSDDEMIVDDALKTCDESVSNLDELKRAMTEYKDSLDSQNVNDDPDDESFGADSISELINASDLHASSSSKIVHDTNPSFTDEMIDVVDLVVSEFGLNEQQERALKVVAYHKICRSDKQLMMIVAGPGGTGKSRVIAALTSLFEKLNSSHQLKKAAPTGIAAYAIGGTTVHSLLGLMGSNVAWGKTALQKAQDRLAGVTDIFVDEFSMIGADFLSRMSTRLSEVTTSPRPFGGLNITFFGDPRQLPPVGDNPLWKSLPLPHATPDVTQPAIAVAANSTRGQRSTHGQGLWSQIEEVVLLRENHRAALDKDYVETVERIAKGKGTQADRDAFLSRDITKAQFVSDEWIDAPLVTADKVIRDRWNVEASRSYASRNRRELHDYVAADKMSGEQTTGQFRQVLLNYPSSTRTHDRLGRLPLAIGMKVMIMHNILTSVGVVNGAEGTVERIIYDTGVNEDRVATVIFVRVKGALVDIPGLESGVVPVFPDTVTMKLPLKDQRTISVVRSQMPLLPAYSFTDYKSQARTLEHVVLDLASAGSLESAYVMVSRAVGLKNVLLLRPFAIDKIQKRQSPGVIAEMDRLETLDERCRNEFALLEATRKHRVAQLRLNKQGHGSKN